MIEFLKQTLTGQYEAALAMMKFRIEVCPPEFWEGNINADTFRQTAYHALFWFDFYLTVHEDYFTQSELNILGGNEVGSIVSRGLSKEDTLLYIEHCHEKIIDSLSVETQESFEGNSGFPSVFVKRPITRMELHFYNIRHFQHHVGQLSTYLRKVSDENNLSLDLPWVGTGWR